MFEPSVDDKLELLSLWKNRQDRFVVKPLKRTNPTESVDADLAFTIKTKSVYVPGMELKTMLDAPPAPTVVVEISSIRKTPHKVRN